MQTNSNWKYLMESANLADPRQKPIGYFSTDSYVLAGAGTFLWFENLVELIDAIKFGEPTIYEFSDDAAALKAYHEKINPLLQRVETEGLTNELLTAINLAVAEDFQIEWWGHFDDLTHGRNLFASGLIEDFRGETGDEEGESIKQDEVDEFIQFLQNYGV